VTFPSTGAGRDQTLLNALLEGERFWPATPRSVRDAGLTEPFLEALICRYLLAYGNSTGRNLAANLALPTAVLDPALARLRSQQVVAHAGAGAFNDYIYGLTEAGRRRAQTHQQECAYVGPAPVPLLDYVISVEAQATSDEPIRRAELLDAFHDVSVSPGLLETLGPAVNSASGLFLYGAPGNGKSTLARHVTACFGQEIWLPHAFIEGGEIVKVFDPAYHHEVSAEELPEDRDFDRRWVRVRRPTVVVGGELTMDALEIRHDPATRVSEAPLQLKSNCGCLLIDDFGRQRVSPAELLNRWIIPLENRHDFLTLGTGKKIQIPFQQLVIFSTNLNPADLVDEAFLRRIPYRIEVTDPDEEEFHDLFRLSAERMGCDYLPEAVDRLLDRQYRRGGRPLRRCHARDLLQQVRNYCAYNSLPFEMLPEYFDRVAGGFFTAVPTKDLPRGGAA
jgi:predicted ATPase with chaperone activity